MPCWPPSCMCPTRNRASCCARDWCRRSRTGCRDGLSWVRPGRVREDGPAAHWAQSGGHPVGWLSLDAADNDPVRFWRHAVGALDRLCPGIGDAVGPLIGPPAPASFEGLVTALINELSAQPGHDQLLVLDDFHLIDAPLVHGSLMFLIEHTPAGLHLVLASRSDPPLPLARLRARGQLAE